MQRERERKRGRKSVSVTFSMVGAFDAREERK
jgi:hypothetical protein